MKPNIKDILHKSQGNSKRIIPLALVAALLLIFGGYYLLTSLAASKSFTVSGTIEATEIHMSSETGGRVRAVYVQEGEKVTNGEVLVDFHPDSMAGGASVVRGSVVSPIDGVVIERSVEPGEVALAGSTMMIVSNLNNLTLTVYVPEDRYGVIMLGQTYPVSVDSFPGEVFKGTVSHIADQAEFTPRNVQTTDSRKTTVFAIKLILDPSNGKLKPGMPADVTFQAGQ
jgi:multidrug resistance efflux pump